MAKSASTAKTFGVTMEESIGHITAIGAVTMESGNVIGNSLKTIYSRITTMDGVKSVLQDVGVAMTDMSGDARDVNDILEDLASRWDRISDAERQNIAVKVAGRYQLSRFLALMNNYEMAQKATTTAIYSEGSAMRENAEYLKSFEARINSLKNGFTEFASAVGDAVLSDGLMGVIALLGKMADMGVKVVDTIGVLPVTFGAISLLMSKFGYFDGIARSISNAIEGTRTFNKTYRETINTVDKTTTRTQALATAWRAVTVAEAGASAGAVAFGTAVKGALISTGIGAILVGVGYGIEKLIGHFAENKRKAEELEKTNQKMIDTYRSYDDGMVGIVNRYDELTSKTKLTADETEELSRIQKELAEGLPTTVEYIDANGEAHMKNTEQIRKEVEAVKELSKANAELTFAKFEENMEKQAESYDKVTEKIEKLRKKQEELIETDGQLKVTTLGHGVGMQINTEFQDNSEEIQRNKIDILMAESEKTEAIQKTIKAIQDQALAYFEASGSMDALGDAQQKVIEDFSSSNEHMIRYASNFEDAYKNLYNSSLQVGDVFVQAYNKLTEGIDPDDTLKLGEIQTELDNISKSVPKSFLSLRDESGKVVKTTDDVANGLKEVINVSREISGAPVESTQEFIDRLVMAGFTMEDAQGYLYRLATEQDNLAIKTKLASEGIDETTGSLESLNQEAMEAIDLTASLFGYSGTELEGMKSHLQNMHLLVDTMGEAGKQTDKYKASQEALTDFLGITATELEKNKTKYYDIIEALQGLDLTQYNMSMSWEEFIKSSDLDASAQKLLLSWDGWTNLFTGETMNFVDEVEEEVGVRLPAVFNDVELKYPKVDYTSIKDSEHYVEQNAKNIEGTINNMLDKLEELGIEVGKPTGVAFFDEMMNELGLVNGAVDTTVATTDENIRILKTLINTAIENPQLLVGLQQELSDTQTQFGFTNQKIDELKTNIQTGSTGGAFEQPKQEAQELSTEIDSVKQNYESTNQLMSRNPLNLAKNLPLTHLQNTNKEISNINTNAQDTKQTVNDVVTAGNNLGTVNSNMQSISDNSKNSASQVDILSQSLISLGDNFNTENIRNQIKEIGDSAVSANGKIGTFRTNISNIKFNNESLQTYTNSLTILFNSLALTPQYAQPAINSLNTVVSSFGNATTMASTYASALANVGGAVGSSYANMAQTINNANTIIISNYSKNSVALMQMVNNTRKGLNSITASFTTTSALVRVRISNMNTIMNSEFTRGINSLVNKARSIPQRIASAIRSNISYITSAMGAVSRSVSGANISPRVGGVQKGYANGGFIDKLELAWHGEEGAEAIIPLIAKRRKRGLELWEETGKKLGIDTDLINILKQVSTRKSSGGSSNVSGGFGATSGEGGTSGGSDSGSSGVIVNSGNNGFMFEAQATSKSATRELEELVKPNARERGTTWLQGFVGEVEAQMERMVEYSLQYRNALKQIQTLNKQILTNNKQELSVLLNRNKQIEKRLAQLKNTSKHTEKQRKEYNELQNEYDSNLSKISSLRSEVQSLQTEIADATVEIFDNLIEEIKEKYTKAITDIQRAVSDIDFKLEVLELTNPDNIKEQLKLLSDRLYKEGQEEATQKNFMNSLKKQWDSAIKQYGKSSKQAITAQEAYQEAYENYQESVIKTLETEKEIKDIRKDIAENGIDTLKDYYETMRDLSTQAIESELDALEESHKAKMDLYDKEIDKVNEIYDSKLKNIKKQQEIDDYEEELSEKNAERAELMNKRAILSRDNTLEGRKRLAEVESELSSVEKEIADMIKERQRQLLEESIQEQRDAQISQIEKQKELEEESHNSKVEKLEKEKEEIQLYYDNIIDNETRWATIRDNFMKGNFTALTTELTNMSKTVQELNKGNFDSLMADMSNFTAEMKKQFEAINKVSIGNLASNASSALNSAKQASSVTPKDYTGKGTSVSTPKSTTYGSSSGSSSSKPSSGSSSSKKTSSSSSSTQYYTIQKGDNFWDLENKFGLAHGTLAKLNPNVNPNKLKIGQKIVIKKGSTSSSSSSKSSSSSSSANRKTTASLNFRSKPSYGNNVISVIPKDAKVQYIGMENGWAKIKYNGKTGYVGSRYLKAFDTGGYTGDWSGNDGKVALLHKKELVLNERQTSDILDSAKIIDKVSNILPNIKTSSIFDKLTTASSITNISYGDINVTVEGGDKKKATDIASEIMDKLKKKGK